MQVAPNDKVLIRVDFVRGGNPFIPLEGSVAWTLLDNSSAPVVGFVNQPLITGATAVSVTIEVPASQNTVDVTKRYERRRVEVNGIASFGPFTTSRGYVVIPRLNHSVTLDDVAAYVGADFGELSEKDFSLFNAYLRLEEKAGREPLEAALASGSIREIAANRGIVAQAVLDASTSVLNRLMLRHSDGSISVQRQEIPFDALLKRARGDVASAIESISGRTRSNTPMLFLVPRTDVITG